MCICSIPAYIQAEQIMSRFLIHSLILVYSMLERFEHLRSVQCSIAKSWEICYMHAMQELCRGWCLFGNLLCEIQYIWCSQQFDRCIIEWRQLGCFRGGCDLPLWIQQLFNTLDKNTNPFAQVELETTLNDFTNNKTPGQYFMTFFSSFATTYTGTDEKENQQKRHILF